MNRSLTIAVDFDGTLCQSNWPGLGPANETLFEHLKKIKNAGARLILWTCREGNQLEQAVEWCNQHGLIFDAINDNLPELIELFGSNSRKICCDYYIDDKNCQPNDIDNLLKQVLIK